MLFKVGTCFLLLVAVASALTAQSEQDRLRVPQICPDGKFPDIRCFTTPCDPCGGKPPTGGVCTLSADPGPCEAAIPRWFFNVKTKRCEQFTFGGCQGNGNNFQSFKECTQACGPTKPPPTNICFLPSETGFCKARIERWFFNKKSGSCEKFIYGGCGGNKNNFETRAACVAKCGGPSDPVDVCKLPKEIGPCDGAFPRYYFNSASQRCEQFSFGGCDGNKNNFTTLKACQKSCGGAAPPPTDVCKLQAEMGPCRAAITRWFFNSFTRRCETFTYGGCQGNGNNFRTIEECKERCGGGGLFCPDEGKPCIAPSKCSCGECCNPIGVGPGECVIGRCMRRG